MSHPEQSIPWNAGELLSSLLQKRLSGEPVAYLTGSREFWSLDIKVNSDCLIPRPETELLVEWALAQIPDNSELRILDLGTGSGAIALAIASERPTCKITAIDQSAACIDLARSNAEKHKLRNIKWIQSDWFSALPQRQIYDLILSNPPYVSEQDPLLNQGDVAKEPRAALTSGVDGLVDIRQILMQSHRYLKSSGAIGLEHGFMQSEEVRKLLNTHNFYNVKSLVDLVGHERISIGFAGSTSKP